jgi:uncharacterized protein
MLFTIHAEKQTGEKKTFTYDNITNYLKSDDGTVFEFADLQKQATPVVPRVSKNTPGKKSTHIEMIKIQLGLACNYSCEYCSQKFVERGDSTSAKDIAPFMEKLKVLEFSEEHGLRVEYWGGEPLAYIKTLKPLVEAIEERFKSWVNKPKFSIITNGSLLNDETIDFLMEHDFAVSISHDGPGQFVRGPDPFDDPEKKKAILGFYRMMTRLGKGISFNSMLSKRNMSRKEISDWFIELTGDEKINLGEGGLVDAYDDDGLQNSLQTHQEHFAFRRKAFADILGSDGEIAFKMQINKINNFTKAVLSHSHADGLGQKCGMDGENVIAVDLNGNVITCQNVSAAEVAMNGESHKIGNLDDYSNVKLNTATHWSNRAECPACPVLHLCQGACMFLENQFWETSCANAYSDNVAHFALAFNNMTGYIPVRIEGEGLPLERQDVFGTQFEHHEKAVKKIIPIKVVSDVTTLDGVSVYGKARVEA